MIGLVCGYWVLIGLLDSYWVIGFVLGDWALIVLLGVHSVIGFLLGSYLVIVLLCAWVRIGLLVYWFIGLLGCWVLIWVIEFVLSYWVLICFM